MTSPNKFSFSLYKKSVLGQTQISEARCFKIGLTVSQPIKIRSLSSQTLHVTRFKLRLSLSLSVDFISCNDEALHASKKHSISCKDPPPPTSEQHNAKFKTALPPRPPSSNLQERKLALDPPLPENSVPATHDSGIKVIVRMWSLRHDKDEGDSVVQKISNQPLPINGQNFTFDSVADTEATQLDIFQLAGVPLVENCLAGFNSSVSAYGETGSGKTYVIWGPANSFSDLEMTNETLHLVCLSGSLPG